VSRAFAVRFGSIVLVVGALCALAACSGAERATPTARRPPIRLVRITTDAQVITPAVALLPNATQDTKILLAYDTLLSRCVAASGQTFAMSPSDRPDWITIFTQPFAGVQPFGPVNPRRMAQFGFHDPVANPSGGEHVAYVGTPTPREVILSCDTSVTRSLGGPPTADIRPLIADAGAQAGSDPRRAGPRRAWVDCMKQRGYAYQSDGDPITEFEMDGEKNSTGTAISGWSSHISSREIAVADADAACQQSSRNVDTQVALLTAYESAALDQHPELVAAYQHYLNALLAKAARIIATYPAPTNRVEWDGSKGEGPASSG
jgi:hypothetical protein